MRGKGLSSGKCPPRWKTVRQRASPCLTHCAKLSLAAEISRRLAGRAGFHESATASPRYGQPGKQTKIQTKLGNKKRQSWATIKRQSWATIKTTEKGFHELTTVHDWHGNLSNKVNKQNHKQTNKPRQERKKRKKGRPTAPPESKQARQQTECQQNAWWSCLFALIIVNNSKAIARRWFKWSNCFER